MAAQGQAGILGASLAMPGPFDYDAGISWMQHKLPYLYGFDLRQALAAAPGVAAVSRCDFLNDAAAYLMGEIAAGAARGVSRVVGITLGTGVGSAFAVDGHVVREGTGVPAGGEIWNVPYEGGIVEDQISTRAIQKSYKARTGQDREVAAIAGVAARDPVAAEVFSEFGRNLGLALRTVLSSFGPHVMVLGGGIARSAQLFLPAAQGGNGKSWPNCASRPWGTCAPDRRRGRVVRESGIIVRFAIMPVLRRSFLWLVVVLASPCARDSAALSPIPDERGVGSKGAPIVIEVFSDFQCHGCAEFYLQTLAHVIEDYCNKGLVYLIHREYPLPIPSHRYALRCRAMGSRLRFYRRV